MFSISSQLAEFSNAVRTSTIERLQLIPAGKEVSVWWIIVRGNLDHEIHHRGQLSSYLRAILDTK